MSLRNRLVLPFIFATLAFLVGCGSSNSAHAVPPPGGGFSNSNLTGTYVFSVSGTDSSGDSVAVLGAFAADGSGHISGGTIDINDVGFQLATNPIAPIPNAPIASSGSGYSVGVDGRGRATLATSTPFKTITLDFVLSSSSHGLIIEFDGNASGSGTLDLQATGLTQTSLTGSYAFSFAGGDESANASFATVGAFALNGNGGITSGTEDFNDGNFAYPGQALGGQVILGPSSTPTTTLSTQSFALKYDVYAIDATHLKFIEMDASPILSTLSGDAFSQPSASIPAETLSFVLAGLYQGNPSAAGGFMVADGNGGITGASTEDVTEDVGGSVQSSSSPLIFSGSYASGGPGRLTLNLPTIDGFFGGSAYAAYPSSGGLLLLEIDDAGIMSGAAFPQSPAIPALASSEGYGLNLTGGNLANGVEVDDVAEFATASGGSLTDGIIDENYAPAGGPNYGIGLSAGTYGAIDSNGRFGVSATAGSGSKSTLNGGFNLTLYSVDGTTFPFIETDGGQIAAGVVVEQSSTGASAAAQSHMFIPHQLVRPNTAHRQKK